MGKPMFRLGLTGYPLGHSLSPAIHEAAMNALNLHGEYRLYPIPPTPEGIQDLEALLQNVANGELQGLNVTIPHKQTVLRWMGNLASSARYTGAVNTIYTRYGKLGGDNTDVGGFQHDLNAHLPLNRRGGLALVLGAGGSARAVVHALRKMGWQVSIAARRVAQAEQLIASMTDTTVQAIELSPAGLRSFLATLPNRNPAKLIVNTTPLGMSPNPEASPWPVEVPFPSQAFVYDLVYNPPETSLVSAARQAGLEACSGLGMLVEQAALSFEKWTGVTAPRQIMMAAAMQSLTPGLL